MGGTCYEVFMAYALNAPTLWNFDFSLQMYGAIFMMAGAYTLSTEAHVRGDVIYRLFSQKTQAYIDLVLYFIFFFPGVIALAFYGYEYAALAWKIKETSWNSPAQIQIYMAKSLIPLSGTLLTIQGVSEVFMAYALNAPTLWNFDFSLQMYGAIFMMAGAYTCLLYTSPSPRDATLSRMPSSA